MRLGLASCAAILCALPAYGDPNMLPQSVVNALTPIDSVPSMAALNDAFTPQAALEKLLLIALDRTVDLGIELRAIRALPSFCTQPCGAGNIVHDNLSALVLSEQAAQHTPKDLLRLRAAVEALGQTRSGLDADVDALMPMMASSSRDLRATVVRALLNICNIRAVERLNKSYATERVAQVKAEIYAAIQDLQLRQCGN